MGEVRSYRSLFRQQDLVHFEVVVRETDLSIGVRREVFSEELVRRTSALVRRLRSLMEAYVAAEPGFVAALAPYEPGPGAPAIAVDMARAAAAVGVGPMAAVAGAFAQYTGRFLARHSRDVVVENGGDIYLKTSVRRTVGIYAGTSPFSHRLALEVQPFQSPLGICTSSGTVGPSLSFGRADAVVILAPSPLVADAAATAVGNRVQGPGDVEEAALFAGSLAGVAGAVVIAGDRMAAWGEVKLVPLDDQAGG
ncbi:MAG TPA: UPF0280 family protein [Spirochaetia bacterium]|nr:UPF0280 family protein [Spirochaetia bacterium]